MPERLNARQVERTPFNLSESEERMTVKLSKNRVGQLADEAGQRCVEIAMEACSETTDLEQRYVLITEIAARLFGACGAEFQRMMPRASKLEAASATVQHIQGVLQRAYAQ